MPKVKQLINETLNLRMRYFIVKHRDFMGKINTLGMQHIKFDVITEIVPKKYGLSS